MTYRPATPEDIERICQIIASAKESLRSRAIDQWQRGYPNREVVEGDIGRGVGRVVCDSDGTVVGYGALILTGEPAYDLLTDGEWLTEGPYGVIHRLCTHSDCARKGVANFFMAQAEEELRTLGIGSMRIDTHPENLYMQGLITKREYTYCGNVIIESLRLAYEKEFFVYLR